MKGDGRVFLRGTTWWVSYYRRGREFRESSGSPEQKKAEELLRQRLAEIRTETFVAPQQQRVTVAELLASYKTNREVSGCKSLRKMASPLARLTEALGTWRAVDVTLPRLERYVSGQLAAGAARGSIKTRLAFLHAAFEVTRRQGLHRLRPDFPQIRPSPARRGFYAAAEFRALYAALPEPINELALFGYLTGWRKEEITGLTWAMVDRAEGVIRIAAEDSKNDEAGGIAYEGELAALIERRWKARVVGTRLAEHVFHRRGRPVRAFGKAWDTACGKVGLTGRLFHDFRRTAVRDMVNAGVPEKVAMTISRHRTRSVFQRYHIVAPGEQRRALAATEQHRAAALTDNRPGRSGQLVAL